MANYVKFLRGTPAAYERLRNNNGVNSDTLYFIYEEDESTGVLYLGSKLIAGSTGGEIISGATLLSQLKDVLISENLVPDSFLVYDEDAAAWVNKHIEDLIFVGATANSSGLAGMVPAPEANQLDLFLKSDGTWAKPFVDHTILTLENTDHSVHSDMIIKATDGVDNVSGDIVIIKDLISEGKWQYTAYVFDNSEWHAMDGNYNAENVYFDEDLITTTAVGNITLTDGQATIASAGKNLKQVFETIFVKEENPKTTKPSVTLTFGNAKAYEVGSLIRPSYSATFNKGKYSYDSSTGVAVTSWEVTDSDGNVRTSAKDDFDLMTITDDTNYSITAVANYGDGEIPHTNLGNDYAAGQIKAASASATKGGLVGYRKTFYGTLDNKNELTSAIIRGLKSTDVGSVNGDSVIVDIPVGAYRVVFAYPASLNDLGSVSDHNGLNAEISSGFTMINVDVEGNNKYEAKQYKVYYIDYANANDTANAYTFTIAEEEG